MIPHPAARTVSNLKPCSTIAPQTLPVLFLLISAAACAFLLHVNPRDGARIVSKKDRDWVFSEEVECLKATSHSGRRLPTHQAAITAPSNFGPRSWALNLQVRREKKSLLRGAADEHQLASRRVT